MLKQCSILESKVNECTNISTLVFGIGDLVVISTSSFYFYFFVCLEERERERRKCAEHAPPSHIISQKS